MITLITTHLIKDQNSIDNIEDFIVKNLRKGNIVSSIHLLAEQINQRDLKMLTEKHKRLTITRIHKRPSLEDMMIYSKTTDIGTDFLAFCNADIHFYSSEENFRKLSKLSKIHPSIIYTLTRRQDDNFQRIISTNYPVPEFNSSDAWLANTKHFQEMHLDTSFFSNIQLGKLNLENLVRIGFEANRCHLANACNLIEARHLEQTDNNYHGEFNENEYFHMGGNFLETQRQVKGYEVYSILPIPENFRLEKTMPISWNSSWNTCSKEYIFCDLPAKVNSHLLASLSSLLSISHTFKRVVYFSYQDASKVRESKDLIDRISQFHPSFVVINSDDTKTAIRNLRCGDLIALSHTGLIDKKIISQKEPIFIIDLNKNAKKCHKDIASECNGSLMDLRSIANQHHTDEHDQHWVKGNHIYDPAHLQNHLITCNFNTSKCLGKFLNTCLKLRKKRKFFHSFISTNPESFQVDTIISYLSQEVEGQLTLSSTKKSKAQHFETTTKISRIKNNILAEPENITDQEELIQVLDSQEKAKPEIRKGLKRVQVETNHSTEIPNNEVTIVTACRNREENLKKVIKSWLKIAPKEIIICDWGCYQELTLERLGLTDDEGVMVRIIRHEATKWVLTWAFNEALSAVKTRYTLKLDCDHWISHDFIRLNPIGYKQFRRGHWNQTDQSQKYINGAIFSCSYLLKSIGYFDERITTYGWDDSDIQLRLFEHSIGSGILNVNSIRHIEQSEEARTKEQAVTLESALAKSLGVETTLFLITRNRVLSGLRWDWSAKDYRQKEFTRNKINNLDCEEDSIIEYANIKAFEKLYEWFGEELKKRGCGSSATELYLEAVYKNTKDKSARPSTLAIADLLKRYTSACKEGNQLEKNLIRMAIYSCSPSSRLHNRIQRLSDIERLVETKTTEKSYQQDRHIRQRFALEYRKKVFIDAQHGLGNRLRAIASAACIANALDRELVVIWTPDHHCECKFSDLFKPDLEVEALESLGEINNSTHAIYDYMDHKHGQKNKKVEDDTEKNLFLRSAFVFNSIHTSWDKENHFLRALRPQSMVMELVDSVPTPNLVTAHIRMQGGKCYEHLPHEKSSNWSQDDHQLINYWRQKSHYNNFTSRIKALVDNSTSNGSIFVAADIPETYRYLEEEFGENLNFLKREIYDRSCDQLRFALADVILLGKTETLLGSYWSSFSELAQRLSTTLKKVEMSGIDF